MGTEVLNAQRVAKAWMDMTSGSGCVEAKAAFGGALFNEPLLSSSPSGLVLVKDITFAALGEDTLLPFHGRCHIAYIPKNGVILGLSKLSRVTRAIARRVQTQESLTDALLKAITKEVKPNGTAVIIQATHIATQTARLTVQTSGLGLNSNTGLLEELSLLLGLPIDLQEAMNKTLIGQSCSLIPTLPPIQGSSTKSMLEKAVTTLLLCVGETPERNGLAGCQKRYVTWLQNATSGYSMQPLVCDGGPPTPEPPSRLSSGDMSSGDDMAVTSGVVETFKCDFASQCEHHLLPFYGSMLIAYESQLHVSAAQLQRIVDMYSKRLQVQERLSHQVADAIVTSLKATNVLVLCESAHMCMVARGVEEHASTTLTTAVRGEWIENSKDRSHALHILLAL